MPPRLMDRMWSTQPSKNARSCETSRKPDFLARYRLTSARPVSSRWFVGSSMSRYRPSRAKSSASRIFACSPPESVENGRYSASSVTNSGASSRRRRHCGTSGKLHSSSSSGVSAASGMGYGKYSNPPGAVIVPWWGYWPCRRRRSVVLPRPLRPVRPSRQSVSSWKLTCSNTGSKLPGYVKVRSVIWINAIGMPSFRQPRIPSTIAGDRIGGCLIKNWLRETLPQPKGILRLPQNGQTVCTEAERQSRFPAKRHNEPGGLHRQRVTIVPGFQQEIMRMLSNSLLFFII